MNVNSMTIIYVRAKSPESLRYFISLEIKGIEEYNLLVRDFFIEIKYGASDEF